MAKKEEKRGRSRRARGSPCAAHVVRRFSESAARKVAPRPIKPGTSFSNLLCPRPLADRLVLVDTRGLGRPPDRVLKGTSLSAACGQGSVCRPPVSGLEGELRSLRSLIDSKPGREASVYTESLKVAKPQGYNQDTPSPSAGGPKTGLCWHTHLMWSLGGHWAGALVVCGVPSFPRPSAGAVPLPKTCSA